MQQLRSKYSLGRIVDVRGEHLAELLRAVLAVVHGVHRPEQVRRPERAALGRRRTAGPDAARTRRTTAGSAADGSTTTAPRWCTCRRTRRTTPCRRRRSARAPASAALRTPPTPARSTASWYGGYGAHIDGMRIPPRSPDSCGPVDLRRPRRARRRSARARRPRRRSGLRAGTAPRASGCGPGLRPAAGRVGVAAGAEPGAERRRRAAGHGVGVGEDHLAGDAVGVELLVAPRPRPSRREALLVLGSHSSAKSSLRIPRVARSMSRARSARLSSNASRNSRIEPLAVLLARESGVAVGRDHQIAVHGHPPGSTWSSASGERSS